MPQFVTTADQANMEVAGTLIRAGARAAVTSQGSEKQETMIRDEDRSQWGAGTYRLIVYCVGSEAFYAHLKIGESSEISDLSRCSHDVMTGTVDVKAESDSVGAAVVIVSAGKMEAAVAYQVQRL